LNQWAKDFPKESDRPLESVAIRALGTLLRNPPPLAGAALHQSAIDRTPLVAPGNYDES
jgi:hypothetical protein